MLCKSWKRLLGDDVELLPLELAGRGYRFKDPFYENINEAVEDLFRMLKREEGVEYYIYGHSFGALLAYELYYRILSEGMKLPAHMFYSGCKPPHKGIIKKNLHLLTDRELILEVIKFDGMEKEVLENTELLGLFTPVFRADFKLIDEYCFRKRDRIVECPVTVLYSHDMEGEEVRAWGDLLAQEADYRYIEGGHFFIRKNTRSMLNVVAEKLDLNRGEMDGV